MTILSKLKALHLLTYSEAMTRLQMCYKSGASVQEWQAYIDGEPACFGVCFLRSTPNAYTVLATRNTLMQCHLSFNRSASTQILLFRLVDDGPKNL
jgi:hypothetical protein